MLVVTAVKEIKTGCTIGSIKILFCIYLFTFFIPGALGLKAAKVGAVGAGLAGALALKSKASVPHSEKIHIYYN